MSTPATMNLKQHNPGPGSAPLPLPAAPQPTAPGLQLPYRLLMFTCLQSFANTLATRGAYFYTHQALAFTSGQNLALALAVGVAYVVGALLSHRAALRLGQKRALLLTLFCQVLCLAPLVLVPTAGPVVAALVGYSFFSAAMWPLVESFVSAGRGPLETSRIIGFYNVCWSTACPAAVWSSGPIIGHLGGGLFGVAAACTIVGFLFLRRLPARPVHYAADHPDRPPAQRLVLFRSLLLSSRWSLVLSYALLYVLSPLMPALFMDHLHLSLGVATLLAGCIDAARAATFLLMAQTHRWHGRRSILFLTAALLPLGFLIALFGFTAPVIVAGELLFGVGMGLAYYAALYYAMVVSNASVDAGGWHEAIIGSGFTLGPAAALAGASLGALAAGPAAGLLIGVGPLLALFGAGALYPLLRRHLPSAPQP